MCRNHYLHMIGKKFLRQLLSCLGFLHLLVDYRVHYAYATVHRKGGGNLFVTFIEVESVVLGEKIKHQFEICIWERCFYLRGYTQL